MILRDCRQGQSQQGTYVTQQENERERELWDPIPFFASGPHNQGHLPLLYSLPLLSICSISFQNDCYFSHVPKSWKALSSDKYLLSSKSMADTYWTSMNQAWPCFQEAQQLLGMQNMTYKRAINRRTKKKPQRLGTNYTTNILNLIATRITFDTKGRKCPRQSKQDRRSLRQPHLPAPLHLTT